MKNKDNAAEFVVGNLSGPRAARDLTKFVLSHSNTKSVVLDFSRTQKVFPNGAVPFACTVDSLRGGGHAFSAVGLDNARSLSSVFEPLHVAEHTNRHEQLTDLVWEYSSETDAGNITKRFMGALLDRMPCEEGVYDTLNWCLYEVLDNVFQHSQSPSGYVMMQLHNEERKCVISVSDLGIGIHRAMANGAREGRIPTREILSADTAISYAIKQGVTSKGRTNQGNGLFGLSRSVEINGGALTIHSGKGTWSFKHDRVDESRSDTHRPIIDPENHSGTTVDWQLNCQSRVSIGDALGSTFDSSVLVESIETIEGFHELDASELEHAIGSRNQGREIRTRILNYLNAGVPQILLNMTRLDTISSSFADEVLGRLAVELGDEEYRNRIILIGASNTNLQLISRAIEMRKEAETQGG